MDQFPYARRETHHTTQDDYHHQNNSSTHPSSSSSSQTAAEREHMFEKVVTPSDVGKLNRLVIPKQHAERYFPLDPTSNEKGGLLLNFEEDRTGKPWRFRYSYWNSSQSYVMTKGWSRFVKDKGLDAGDTVSFSRGVGGQLFIDWRRRPVPLDPPGVLRSAVVPTWGWGAAGLFPTPHYPGSANGFYFRSMGPTMQGILESVPVGVPRPAVVEPKPVRLFGVNLECSRAPTDQERPPPSPLQWQLSAGPSSARSELSLLPLPPPPTDTDSRSKEEARRG